LKEVVRTPNPNLPLLHASSYMELYLNQAVKGPRLAENMTATMGAVGLLLAIAGLYGLVAYNVSRRTREIGIRMALGALSSDVLRLMMGKGLVLVGIGTAVGLALGFAVEQLMNSMFDSTGMNIVAYLIVVPALFLVAMLAAYVPARRASKIAPTQALRHE
jgi:putative ABC transport system permease protein